MPTGIFPQHRGRPKRIRNLPVDPDHTTSDSSDTDEYKVEQEKRRQKRLENQRAVSTAGP